MATVGQLYDVVSTMNKADRYITDAYITDSTTLHIVQNNAEEFTIVLPEKNTGGGGDYTGDVRLYEDRDGDLNVGNWTINAHAVIIDRDELGNKKYKAGEKVVWADSDGYYYVDRATVDDKLVAVYKNNGDTTTNYYRDADGDFYTISNDEAKTKLYKEKEGTTVYTKDADGHFHVQGQEEIATPTELFKPNTAVTNPVLQTTEDNWTARNTTLAKVGNTVAVDGKTFASYETDGGTYSKSFTVMDTAGNGVTITDIAKGSAVADMDRSLSITNSNVGVLTRGFQLKVQDKAAQVHEDRIEAGNTIEFVTNLEAGQATKHQNISLDYSSSNGSNPYHSAEQIVTNNKISINMVDNPEFDSVTVGGFVEAVEGEGGHEAYFSRFVIDSSGVGFKKDAETSARYYVTPEGLNAGYKPIYAVETVTLNDSILSNPTDKFKAVNVETVQPIWKAVQEDITFTTGSGGVAVNLYTDTEATSRTIGINGSSNIVTSASGNNITISTVQNPVFNQVTVGDASTGIIIGKTDNTGSQQVIDNLENKSWTVSATEDSVPSRSGRAATEDQLAAAVKGLKNLGYSFITDDGTVNRSLGQAVHIVGGPASTAVYAPGNIGITGTGDTLTVGLVRDVNLTAEGSLTVGNSKLDNVSLVITNGLTDDNTKEKATYSNAGVVVERSKESKLADLAFTRAEVSAGNLQIHNVASGLTASADVNVETNAANISDVKTLATNIGNSDHITATSTTDANGKLTYNLNLNESIKLGKAESPGHNILLDAVNNKIEVGITDTAKQIVIDGSSNNQTGGSIFVGEAVKLNTTGLAITDGPSVTTSGISAGDMRIKNVASGFTGTIDEDAPTMNYAANIGDIVGLAEGSKNISINEKADKKGYTVDLKNHVVLDNSETTNKLELSGTTGRITLTNTYNSSTGALVTGEEVSGTNITAKATIGVRPQGASVHGDEFARLMYTYDLTSGSTSNDAIIATLQDGIIFRGDNYNSEVKTTNVEVDLSSQNRYLSITGGATAGLTDNNIGVIGTGDANYEGKNALTIKLNKDIDLTANGSLKIGGIVISNADSTTGTTTHKAGVDAGGKPIYNMKSGIEIPVDENTGARFELDNSRDANGLYTAGWDNNAASIGDVKEMTTNVVAGKDGAEVIAV